LEELISAEVNVLGADREKVHEFALWLPGTCSSPTPRLEASFHEFSFITSTVLKVMCHDISYQYISKYDLKTISEGSGSQTNRDQFSNGKTQK